MKKLILMILAFGFFAASANAQSETDFRDRIAFGLKAGINYSNVYDEVGDQFTADSKLGFVGGVFLSIPIGTFLGVQPEVHYSQKGFKSTGTILGVPFEDAHTTTFIDVPLLICIKPSEYFTLMAGPQYSYLIKEKDSFTILDETTSDEVIYRNDNIRKNIFCFVGGFDVNVQNIVLSARAGWDLQNNNGDGTSYNPRYKNVWYQGTLGIRF